MNMTTRLLLVAFVLMGLGVAVRAVSRLPVFDIKAITITGEVFHSNAVTLRANVLSHINGSFFSVDLQPVQAAFEAVPWVRQAVVHREFPNRLRVQLQEHVAVGYWGSDAQSQLINSFGEVFEANVGEVEQETLPRLNAQEEQSVEVLNTYRALAPLFESEGLPIDTFELTRRGSWRARLDRGAEIELGRGSLPELVARTQRFLKTLNQVTRHYARNVSAIESADLRHENGYAIRLRGVSTLAANGLDAHSNKN